LCTALGRCKRRLRAEGCSEIQGFLFSCPLPAAGIERLLARDFAQRAVA
jgi:EAL domain-containing protein (putative c-di-GMP-specific phosphodiesterase class I)